MDVRICLLLAAEAGLALVLLWSAGVLRKPAHVLCAALLLAAAVLAAAIPFFLPHMHDRYFFAADALTLALAATWPQLALPALLCEFASLLGYHAYLRMRYLLPMADGALALIAALAVLTAVLVTETRQTAPAERKTKKST